MTEKRATLSFVFLQGETEIYISRSHRKYKGAYRLMNLSPSYYRIMRIRELSENNYNRWYVYPESTVKN